MYFESYTRRATRASSAKTLEEAIRYVGVDAAPMIAGAMTGNKRSQMSLARRMRQTTSRLVVDDTEFGIGGGYDHFVPEGDSLPSPDTLDARIRRWVIPGGAENALGDIERHLLRGSVAAHCAMLRSIAKSDSGLFELLMAGHIGAALKHLACNGAKSQSMHGTYIAVDCLRNQWKIYVAATCYSRIELIRNSSIHPVAPLSASGHFKNVGHTFDNIVGGPAKLVAEALELAQDPKNALLSDTEAMALLVHRKILASDDTRAAKMAREIKAAYECKGDDRRAVSPNIISTMGILAKQLGDVSADELKRWSRLTFVEARWGLDIHASAAFIADQTLRAFDDIDRLVHRWVTGTPKPTKAKVLPSKRRVTTVAELLRAMFATDPRAKPIGMWGVDLDPHRKNGSAGYDRMKSVCRKTPAQIMIPPIHATFWLQGTDMSFDPPPRGSGSLLFVGNEPK
ncbi:MAG: hypothetical protein ACTHM8_03035 [Sphingomonas sp.]